MKKIAIILCLLVLPLSITAEESFEQPTVGDTQLEAEGDKHTVMATGALGIQLQGTLEYQYRLFKYMDISTNVSIAAPDITPSASLGVLFSVPRVKEWTAFGQLLGGVAYMGAVVVDGTIPSRIYGLVKIYPGFEYVKESGFIFRIGPFVDLFMNKGDLFVNGGLNISLGYRW